MTFQTSIFIGVPVRVRQELPSERHYCYTIDALAMRSL